MKSAPVFHQKVSDHFSKTTYFSPLLLVSIPWVFGVAIIVLMSFINLIYKGDTYKQTSRSTGSAHASLTRFKFEGESLAYWLNEGGAAHMTSVGSPSPPQMHFRNIYSKFISINVQKVPLQIQLRNTMICKNIYIIKKTLLMVNNITIKWYPTFLLNFKFNKCSQDLYVFLIS